MKVKDFMSKDLIVIDANDSVRNALRLMKKHKVHRLLVKRKGKIVGIVTERDILRRLGKEKERKLSDAHIHVSSCYSKNLITINSNEDIKKAAKLMLEKGISSLAVEENGEIVGIITKTDLIKALKDNNEKVEKWMKRKVITIDLNSRILEARKIMLAKKIKRLVVTKGGYPYGIITEGDIAKVLGEFRKVAEGKQWDEKMRRIYISDIVSKNLFFVRPNDKISKVVKIMFEKGISGLPVIENNKLVGIITKTDLIKIIAK